MIDIETMGVSHDAVIIQLAAVQFDIETGEIGQKFVLPISMDHCMIEGFRTDKSTQEWWATQNQDILNKILENGMHPETVMEDFSRLMFDNDTKVWCHTTFDFPIVQNYLKHFKKPQMPYKLARDIRTLVGLSGIDLNSYDWSQKTHDALDDCLFQIQYCVDAYRVLMDK